MDALLQPHWIHYKTRVLQRSSLDFGEFTYMHSCVNTTTHVVTIVAVVESCLELVQVGLANKSGNSSSTSSATRVTSVALVLVFT